MLNPQQSQLQLQLLMPHPILALNPSHPPLEDARLDDRGAVIVQDVIGIFL